MDTRELTQLLFGLIALVCVLAAFLLMSNLLNINVKKILIFISISITPTILFWLSGEEFIRGPVLFLLGGVTLIAVLIACAFYPYEKQWYKNIS